MSEPSIPFPIPVDLAERCKRTRDRVRNGEPMTYQHLADALGLPFEFVSVAVGLTIALQTGQPVVIDPAALKPAH